MNTALPRYAFLAFFIGIFTSCSSSNAPEGPGLKGKVTLGGKPVQSGTINFEAKNGGTKNVAEVLQGQYKTRPSSTAVSGPQIARLVLMSAGPADGGAEAMKAAAMKKGSGGDAKQDFSKEYTLEIDVPAGTLDFDLAFPDKS